MNPWLIVAALVGALMSGVAGFSLGSDHAEGKANADKLVVAKQTLRLMENNTRSSNQLQDNADNLRKAKNAKIATLNADLAVALAGLSARPTRPTAGDVSTDTRAGPAASSTGAGLYREDAGFLIGEAARAKRVLLDLAECQAAYNKVRVAQP